MTRQLFVLLLVFPISCKYLACTDNGLNLRLSGIELSRWLSLQRNYRLSSENSSSSANYSQRLSITSPLYALVGPVLILNVSLKTCVFPGVLESPIAVLKNDAAYF